MISAGVLQGSEAGDRSRGLRRGAQAMQIADDAEFILLSAECQFIIGGCAMGNRAAHLDPLKPSLLGYREVISRLPRPPHASRL